VPNLGQPVTETAIRGRCGGARMNRRCGGIDTRKLHGQSQQQGGGRRRLQDPLRGDHLRRGPPILGGPIEAQEQATENDGTSRQSERPSRDAGGDKPTNKICRGAPRAVKQESVFLLGRKLLEISTVGVSARLLCKAFASPARFFFSSVPRTLLALVLTLILQLCTIVRNTGVQVINIFDPKHASFGILKEY